MTTTTFYIFRDKAKSTKYEVEKEHVNQTRNEFLEKLRLGVVTEVWEVVNGSAKKLNYFGNKE